jgi:ADP-ribosyl-[dinitrogen reductase] hydrolase
MKMVSLHSKIAGSFYGLLVGDALGCPVEGYSSSKIKRDFGEVRDMFTAKNSRHPKGLHTDDGQQALAVCDSLLADPDHPGREFAKIILELYRAGPNYGHTFGLHRGTGRNFRETIKALERGVSWDRAATFSAGNGAAMRIAPLALYFKNDFENISRGVVDISRVTHSDIKGIAAAATVAFLTYEGLNKIRADEIDIKRVISWVSETEKRAMTIFGPQDGVHQFSEALRILNKDLARPEDGVYEKIIKLAGNKKPIDYPTNGYVFESVLTAIFLFLRSKDFESCLVKAISLGGDTDTIGALIGAMCGALYGLEAIPKRWLDDLVAYGEMEDRIEALALGKRNFVPAKSIIELESKWQTLYSRG